jgi:hypothetical protein
MNEIVEGVAMNIIVFVKFSYEVSEKRLLIGKLFKVRKLAHDFYNEWFEVFFSKC